MSYSLRRVSDGAGDSGLMSMGIYWDKPDENGYATTVQNDRPTVGAAIRVGSHYSRTYQRQDWWQTTPVTEILEEWTEKVNSHEIEYVRFKTLNSEYIWSRDL